MKLFKKNKTFVKTSPNDTPKIRFEKVLFEQLEKEGYKYVKSKNQFIQDFEFGKRIISLSYVNTSGLIHCVQYFSKIIFTDLEKAFKKVYPEYGWTNWTLHFNHHWTESWMCNPKTGKYTDKSINKLASEFFKKIKPEIDTIFSKNTDYKCLERTYNAKADYFFDFLPSSRLEKRIINGLLLSKTFNHKNYDLIKDDYYSLIDKYKGNDLDKIRTEVENGIQKIEKEKIEINTTANKR